MTRLEALKIKIFADGADKAGILEIASHPLVKGFTTNPTLMRKAGISDYEAFAKEVLQEITTRPISFEVFSDDFGEMERQGLKIASWGANVYVKIPVTNTLGAPSAELIHKLAHNGVKLNVTALTTTSQVKEVAQALKGGSPSVISVFAGRIADTGVDPIPMMKESLDVISDAQEIELLWASPRELLNIFQADEIGCHVITVTNDVLKKLSLVGKNLQEYSLDTVKMFRDDAVKAGYTL